MEHTYGGIEAGGTKFVCAIGSGPDNIIAQTQFPTTTPEETLERAVDFFCQHDAPLRAVGIGSFGPLDLHPGSPTYGYITSTPKPGWKNADVVGPVAQALNVPVGFDTDVNAAALGEQRWGAAQGLDNFIYVTIGTGIGGGAMAGGSLLHGLVHPEMGHMFLPHSWEEDPYPGFCPYHGDCFEGLAAGPAISGRWGQPGETLPAGHPAWELEAKYIALAFSSLACILSPQRIIAGGGVMQQPHLLPMVQAKVQTLLNGYIQAPLLTEQMQDYIVLPGLGSRAGVLGSIALAVEADRYG